MAPNPFTTLGLPPRFALDRKVLDAAYRELSKSLHPDRHVQAAAAERRRVLASAIDVGNAYRLLKDPLRRAQWLIERAAELTGDEANVTQQMQRADPEFLMDIMEQREELAAARRSGKLSDALALAAPMQSREAEALAELSSALDSGPVAQLLMQDASVEDAPNPPSSESEPAANGWNVPADATLSAQLSSAASALARLRYFRRFLDEVAAIEDELD